MQKQVQKRTLLTQRQFGLIFLGAALLWGIPALLTGHFNGATMGSCMVAGLGSLLTLLLSLKPLE